MLWLICVDKHGRPLQSAIGRGGHGETYIIIRIWVYIFMFLDYEIEVFESMLV